MPHLNLGTTLMKRIYCTTLFAISVMVLSACAKNTNTQDVYEAYNRKAFDFNITVDKTLIKPVAQAYDYVTPQFVRTGVTNFFNNLAVPGAFINDIFQGKGRFAIVDLARFVVNTTVGIVGLIDIADDIGIPDHRNDFGKTFAYWTGDVNSSYLVLPFLGPSTVRDTIALPFDAITDPLFYANNKKLYYGGNALNLINFRANLLSSDALLYNAFDPYAAMRDAYLQTRNKNVLQNNKMGDYYPGISLNSENFRSPYKHPSELPESDEDFDFDDP